jgi:uroporphyrinogen-III synthase
MLDPMFLWVTRSSPYNLLTGHRLRAMGHSALTVPVLNIRAVTQPPLERRPDALIFTSAQAVRHHGFETRLASLKVFAVGDGTARAARRRGYTNVCSANGNVHDLQLLIAATMTRPARLVHYCAKEPAGDLSGFLKRSGFEAERRIVYESHEAEPSQLEGAVAALHMLDGIIIHSPKGAKRVAAVVAGQRWHGIVFCISQACAQEFRELPGLLVKTAEEPDEASLLALLRQVRDRPTAWAQSHPPRLRLISALPRTPPGTPFRTPLVINDNDGPDDFPPTAA